MHSAFCISNYMSTIPPPVNDQNNTYLPHSPERAELKSRLASMASERIDMPLIIAGREIRTGSTQPSVMPHNHRHVLGDWHTAEQGHVQQAIEAALAARARLVHLVLHRSCRHFPPRRRAAHDDLAIDPQRGNHARVSQKRSSRRRSIRRLSWSTSGASIRTTRRSSTPSSRSAPMRRGTRWSTGRSKASCTP